MNYLKINDFNGQLLIGDSSNKEHYKITEKYIEKLECNYEIKQFYFPNMYPHLCIQSMLSEIKFDYSMYIHDDDYLILETLYKCADFLENNQEYSGVGGKAIACVINENDYNLIDSSWEYRVSEVLGKTATERINQLMNNFSVINFSLARTNEFLSRWPSDNKLQDRGIGGEYLPAAMLAIQGKVKMLDDLFVVRQMHTRRSLLPGYFDTFLLPNWAPSIKFSIEYVSKSLAKIDSISYEEAYRIVKRAWQNYYTKVVVNKHYNVSVKESKIQNSKIRKFAKSIPGMKVVFQMVMRFRNKLNKNSAFSINTLLNHNSDYHFDFIKVYNIITNKILKN